MTGHSSPQAEGLLELPPTLKQPYRLPGSLHKTAFQGRCPWLGLTTPLAWRADSSSRRRLDVGTSVP